MSDEMGKLNPEQRRAVEHDSGPLMVLAGPGTGKTRVITQRIAHLMTGRGVRPETIVAVTYTVKAAGQLRERLAGLVGGDADLVHAHTFHGLGLRILRRFADEIDVSVGGFGQAGSGRGGIIDSAQQRRALREIVVEHGLFARARAMGLDAVADRLIKLGETLSNNAIAPADAAAFAVQAAAHLEKGEDGRGMKLDSEAIAGERERVAELAESARALGEFEKVCRERAWMSFGDLLTLPIRILRESKHAAAILRDEWRHMVVDELQDVNVAQLELLRLLMPPTGESPTGRVPDLCGVGDDDQSIYMFRGADDLAFDKFAKIWPEATTLKLTENFRSTPPIVAATNVTIGEAKRRFAPDKVIVSAGTQVGTPAPVECIQLEGEKDDGEVIAAWVRADRAAHPETPWHSYAVVSKSHADGERIRLALEIEGIPAIAAREGSPGDDEGVKTVLAWVRLLAEPHASHVVGQILRRPPFSMEPLVLQRLLSGYRVRVSRFQAGDPGMPDPGGFVDWLGTSAPEDPIATAFVEAHGVLRADAVKLPASALIESIIKHADAAHADLLSGRERAARVSNLVTLVRFARERQGRLDAPGDVRAFCQYWDDLSDKEQGLEVMGADDRVDGIGEQEGEEKPDKVRLITAHSSKGLEFKTVFVPRASPMSGYGKVHDHDDVSLPAGLLDGGDDRTPKVRAKAEQRRLFYVACTRAEERLIVLAKKNKKPSKAEHYFEEILYATTLENSRSVRQGADVLRAAAALGMRRDAGWDGGMLGAAPIGKDDEGRRREMFEEARRQVRTAAAGALDEAGHPDRVSDAVEKAAVTLAECGRRTGALADAQRTGKVPAWAAGTPAGELVRSVLERVGSGQTTGGSGGPAWPGLLPPLDLTYTKIDAYIKCPRCYYLQYHLDLRPPAGAKQIVGQVVHQALEKFYRGVQAADAEGGARPGRAALVAMGRETFMRNCPRQSEVDRKQLDQVIAQLGLAFDQLYDASANTLEVEKTVKFDYGPHGFEAKLDRIDQYTGADGGPAFRIVDYKTGWAVSRLTKPKADDLQLGVYALALSELYGLGDPREQSLHGVAEYWVLSTGQRGVIDLKKIDFDAVHKAIDDVVEGMIAGRWERAAKCKGDCGMFGGGGSAAGEEDSD